MKKFLCGFQNAWLKALRDESYLPNLTKIEQILEWKKQATPFYCKILSSKKTRAWSWKKGQNVGAEKEKISRRWLKGCSNEPKSRSCPTSSETDLDYNAIRNEPSSMRNQPWNYPRNVLSSPLRKGERSRFPLSYSWKSLRHLNQIASQNLFLYATCGKMYNKPARNSTCDGEYSSSSPRYREFYSISKFIACRRDDSDRLSRMNGVISDLSRLGYIPGRPKVCLVLCQQRVYSRQARSHRLSLRRARPVPSPCFRFSIASVSSVRQIWYDTRESVFPVVYFPVLLSCSTTPEFTNYPQR